jgi:hypothetical protein
MTEGRREKKEKICGRGIEKRKRKTPRKNNFKNYVKKKPRC